MTEVAEKVRERYSELARIELELQRERLRALVESADEPAPEGVRTTLAVDAPYKYTGVQTAFGGLFFMTVDTTIGAYDLSGLGGGLGLGASVSWGTAWLNYTIESIAGWDFRFEMQLNPAVVNVNWWGMQGEHIGSFVGGGVSIASGIFGGKGSVSGP